MLGAVSEKILPQPASFNKKKQYEIHEILGTGTFGKVMVRVSAPNHHAFNFPTPFPSSVRHGMFHPSKSMSHCTVLPAVPAMVI